MKPDFERVAAELEKKIVRSNHAESMKILVAALRKVHTDAMESAAKLIDSEEARVLACQSGMDDHFNSSVDLNLRMTTVLLPNLATAIRALATKEDGK